MSGIIKLRKTKIIINNTTEYPKKQKNYREKSNNKKIYKFKLKNSGIISLNSL